LRRYLPEIDLDEEEVPPEVLEKMEVTMSDFKLAMKEVEPSALREIYIELPEVSWDQVGGLEEVKDRLRESIDWPLTKPELFKHFGIEAPRGVLLFGAPGTGKTLLARAIATETQANFITVKGPELFSKWVGESEKAIREIFKKASQAAPSIIFLDEFESIGGHRSSSSDDAGGQVSNRMVDQLLTCMDGIEALDGVVIVAATNRPEMIDRALLRSGRFERVLHITPPDEKSCREILKIHTANMPLGKFDPTDFAKKLSGYTGADIEAVCREAALIAMRAGKKTVTKTHFGSAVSRVRATVTPDMLEYYAKLEVSLTSGMESVKRGSDTLSGIESV
jgi:transitional endoplasmic reticulum ATPase